MKITSSNSFNVIVSSDLLVNPVLVVRLIAQNFYDVLSSFRRQVPVDRLHPVNTAVNDDTVNFGYF